MPLVTIIIPVYNREKYLKRCLDSVMNQTYSNIETIIINDASTDHTLNILKQFQKSYKNVQIINNETNLGVGASRNKGLEKANGDYIYFLDSDDEIPENAIERLVELILTYNTPLVEADHKLVRFNNVKKEKQKEPIIEEINIEKNQEYLLTQSGAVWNKLYNHALLENERFPEDLLFEDAALLFPLLTQVKRTVKTSEVLYYYYVHENSIITSMNQYPNEKLFDIFSIFQLVQQKCQQLGTYNSYENILKDIIREKNQYALLTINTWYPLGMKSHMILLNCIRQYIEQAFHEDDLFSIKTEKKYLYNVKVTLLKKHLELASILYPTLSYNPLDDAKRIITKYKSDLK